MNSLIICILIFLKNYYLLNLIQQRGYHLEYLMTDYLRHFYVFLFFNFLMLPFFLDGNIVLKFLSLILLGLFLRYLLSKLKRKLLFTKRAFRILILSLFFLMLHQSFLIFASEISIFLAVVILKPYDYLVYRYYFKQGKKRLDNFPNIKIGITGSYGKTSTKYYLDTLLSAKYLTYKSPYSYNTAMGLCKISHNLDQAYDIFIAEMGASHKGDIKELSTLVTPDITVITAIDIQHLKTFKKVSNIITEKLELINSQKHGIAFINDDIYQRHKHLITSQVKIFTYGLNGNYSYKVNYQKNDLTNFDVFYKNEYLMTFETSVIGNHNLDNITVAIAIAHYLRVDLSLIAYKVQELTNVKARLSVVKTKYHTIINDGFNANLRGSLSAIEYLMSQDGLKAIITCGFVDLGSLKECNHLALAKAMINIDLCILVHKKQSFTIYQYLINQGKKVYLCKNFKEAYALFLTLFHEKKATLLIENDLLDVY